MKLFLRDEDVALGIAEIEMTTGYLSTCGQHEDGTYDRESLRFICIEVLILVIYPMIS